ncbi:MAG: helix-turn-helix domain-containing protein [Eubacteriales bacterium]|nr:helix-turn-helix domain-containing protein [Eubacteriales bacterium]
MNFGDSVKSLRGELGITQNELASALHVSVSTVSRWELGQFKANRAITMLLIGYAKRNGASAECIARLAASAEKAVKDRMEQKHGKLYSIEHSSLEQLVESVTFPIYVCDIENDELLYLNKTARQMVADYEPDPIEKKCYKVLMRRDTPCPFCHKAQLKETEFDTFDAFRPFDGTAYRIQGKLIRWNGRNAQIRCVSNAGQSVNSVLQKEREEKYQDSLRLRKQNAFDYIAMAHLNLTQNTVNDAHSNNEVLQPVFVYRSSDEFLKAMCRVTNDNAERNEFRRICDRSALINSFYQGKTHICIQHHLRDNMGLYETSLDLFQNPTTFEVEAFAVLRSITDDILIHDAMSALLAIDYAAILLFDAQTGEVHPLKTGYSNCFATEQVDHWHNIGDMEKMLREYCVASDIEFAIQATSLGNITEQLGCNGKYTVSYPIQKEERIANLRIVYTYLDKLHTTIICAMQELAWIPDQATRFRSIQ